MSGNKRYDVIYEKEPRGQVVTDNGIPCTARTCCTRLNWLEEENEQLKDALNQRTDQCDKYYKENEQLKQFKNDVFKLINAKIKLYSHKPVSAPISQPLSVNFDEDVDRLARLSELELLKEEILNEM